MKNEETEKEHAKEQREQQRPGGVGINWLLARKRIPVTPPPLDGQFRPSDRPVSNRYKYYHTRGVFSYVN